LSEAKTTTVFFATPWSSSALRTRPTAASSDSTSAAYVGWKDWAFAAMALAGAASGMCGLSKAR